MRVQRRHYEREIFLLTSVSAFQNGIGSIFLRDILAAAPDIKVHWNVVEPFLTGAISSRSGRLWRALNAGISRLGILNDIRLYIFQAWQIGVQANKIEKAFKATNAAQIWVTTSNPELICIADELSKRGIDIRVTVWDAPEYLIQNLRMSKRIEVQILNHFWQLLRNSRACSVVSDYMMKEYAARVPGLPIVFLRHGIAPLPKSKTQSTENPLRIVFAGSLYSKQEWNAFVGALDAANWNVANRKIQLEFVGAFPLKEALRHKYLILHPPMPQESVLSFMSQADIGYLPYWLEPAKAFVASTSFPGKMTAYSAAGLAIFHHGPEHSSVTDFLTKYPYGVACHSKQSEAILEKLEALIMDIGSSRMQQARTAAMENELSEAAMMRGFRALLTEPGVVTLRNVNTTHLH